MASLFEFKVNYSKVSCVRKFRNFTVFYFAVLGLFFKKVGSVFCLNVTINAFEVEQS